MSDGKTLCADDVRQMVLDLGADDVGFCRVDSPGLEQCLDDALTLLPGAVSYIALVKKLNPVHVRSSAMAVMNNEFHFTNETVDKLAYSLASKLNTKGISACAVPGGFPMDTEKWPNKMWTLSHKPIAEAAGLGRQGFNRNLLHPDFGGFVVLATVIIDRELDVFAKPLEKSPCIGCKSCVQACPTGSIGKDGSLNFINCATHNYRHRLGGFVDWVDSIAAGKKAYKSVFSDSETVSMWQSLSCGSYYTCCNCMGSCPAGSEHMDHFWADRKGYQTSVIRKLLDRGGNVYVLPGSDAQVHAGKLFPPERVKLVASGTRPTDVRNFIRSLSLAFQPGRAIDVNSCFHFIFSGNEPFEATVVVAGSSLDVREELWGTADLTIMSRDVDWISILHGELNPVWAVVTRKLKLKGNKSLMKDFMSCIPI